MGYPRNMDMCKGPSSRLSGRNFCIFVARPGWARVDAHRILQREQPEGRCTPTATLILEGYPPEGHRRKGRK